MKTCIIKAEGISKFDPMTFLRSKYDGVKNVIKQEIKERGDIKWYLVYRVPATRQ